VVDRSERVLGVAWYSGIQLSDQRRAEGSYPRRLGDG
jgi:hypothetical protein